MIPMACEIRIQPRGKDEAMTGRDLKEAARDQLGIHGGISHSMHGPDAVIGFDPATAEGGTEVIFDFASRAANDEWFVWSVKFIGMEP